MEGSNARQDQSPNVNVSRCKFQLNSGRILNSIIRIAFVSIVSNS